MQYVDNIFAFGCLFVFFYIYIILIYALNLVSLNPAPANSLLSAHLNNKGPLQKNKIKKSITKEKLCCFFYFFSILNIVTRW